MVVRRLQSSDAAAYQQVRRRALNDVPQFVGPIAEQEALCDLAQLQSRMDAYESEGIYPFGCFANEQCIGVAGMSRKLNPKYSHKVFFWGLYVLPEFRGRSVASRLMESRIAFARSLGARFATLQVTTTNQAGRAFHQRHGFVSYGIEPQALCLEGHFYDFEYMQLTLAGS